MRNLFDNLAKAVLFALMSDGGTVQLERETSTESQSIDVWFMPKHLPGIPAVPVVLARLARENAVIDPFHDPPSVEDVQRCVLKQHSMFVELRRSKKSKARLPGLWILSAGVRDCSSIVSAASWWIVRTTPCATDFRRSDRSGWVSWCSTCRRTNSRGGSRILRRVEHHREKYIAKGEGRFAQKTTGVASILAPSRRPLRGAGQTLGLSQIWPRNAG